jgi:hypothetical protein
MNGEKTLARPRIGLRPSGRIYRGPLLGIVSFTTPVFGVLYWLAVEQGENWKLVAGVHVAIGLVVLLAWLFLLQSGIQLTDEGVRERGILGRTRQIPRGDARTALLVDLYMDHSTEIRPNLFITDATGKLLLRMRGQFWTVAQMQLVAKQLDVPIRRRKKPETLTDFRETAPQLLYWYERLHAPGSHSDW